MSNPWAIALMVSMLANAALGWAWLQARDAAATILVQRDDARSAASACSDATEALRELADAKALEAKRAQGRARAVAAQHARIAQDILATPAADPGDDCRSARIRIDAWLLRRSAP